MKKVAKKKVAKKAAKKKAKIKKKIKSDNFLADKWDSAVWNDLKKKNIQSVVLKFEGGGDDGCVYDCELQHADGKKTKVECFGGNKEENKLIEDLGAPIWERYGGFNWFDRCSGQLVWNVAYEQIEWTGDHEPEGLDY